MGEYRLEMVGINKSFLSMQALEDAELKVKTGEVHALLGINGAGKSTLIKILSGIYTKDSGEIIIDGEKAHIENATDAMDLGVATVYQNPELVQTFTAFENIFLGFETERKGLFSKMDRAQIQKKAQELVDEFKMDIDLNKNVGDLKPVQKEIVQILSALSKNSKILVLDEPTSILTEKEKVHLFEVIKNLKEKGVSIIYITHRLDEVNEICDTFTVFRDGKNVASSVPASKKVSTSEIAELMIGKKLESLYPERPAKGAGETVLEVKDLQLSGKFKNVSFVARKNEILGIYGLVGSGIDELSKTIFGALKRSGGTIVKSGQELEFKSPLDAIKNSIFLIPGDRHIEGQIGDQSIASNITLSKTGKITSKFMGLIKNKVEKKEVLNLINKLSIATPNEKKLVAGLSGGNQQKVVVGKGLFTDADVYIFCEPTVGVDVGAKYSIYEIMREISKDSAVILISSDCEEIFGMADRIMVLNQGRVTLETDAEEARLQNLLICAVQNI